MIPIKISARNILPGKVTSIVEGHVSALLAIKISPEVKITPSNTSDALSSLQLKVGSPASALIKASSVLVGVE